MHRARAPRLRSSPASIRSATRTSPSRGGYRRRRAGADEATPA
ncbi:hypothetical protein BURPSS13_W0004 [Burkholderia pseudomallei S13]|nr:hypothetical protein BURPSS13_W0004 [Burkholderia pseudomallei S13]